jgi:hypothetical protein
MPRPLTDLTSRTFGKLTPRWYRQSIRKWLCDCACGGQKYVRGHALVQGKTKSCGCLQPQAKPRKRLKMRTKCPCCGQGLPQPIALSDPNMVHLPTQQQALFNLVKANPEGLTSAQIRERIFHTNKDGEPYCHQIVPTTTHHVNEKIAPWGLKIVASGGPGSVFRLVAL